MFVGTAQSAVVSSITGLHYFGPVTHHMVWHIVLMNLLAPAIALFLTRSGDAVSAGSRSLTLAATIQIVLIWLAHVPFVMAVTLHNPLLHFIGMAGLFGAALWFWTRVLSINGTQRWQSIAALLVTGKLFCLLGIIIAFAPRPIYGAGLDLHDQQLAGLLMTAACPLSFVAAGVVLAVRWINELRMSGIASTGKLG